MHNIKKFEKKLTQRYEEDGATSVKIDTRYELTFAYTDPTTISRRTGNFELRDNVLGVSVSKFHTGDRYQEVGTHTSFSEVVRSLLAFYDFHKNFGIFEIEDRDVEAINKLLFMIFVCG